MKEPIIKKIFKDSKFSHYELIDKDTNEVLWSEKNITSVKYLLDRIDKLTQRYIEAEKFIMNLNSLSKLFSFKKINNFLKSRLKKYDF